MTEQQIIDYLKKEFKERNTSVYSSYKKIGYRSQTIYSWFNCDTHMTLDGLADILSLFGKIPAVRDKEGKYHKDVLGYLSSAVIGNEKWVYALFAYPRYGRQYIKDWTTGVRRIKVNVLIQILDVLDAKLVILKAKNGRSM